MLLDDLVVLGTIIHARPTAFGAAHMRFEADPSRSLLTFIQRVIGMYRHMLNGFLLFLPTSFICEFVSIVAPSNRIAVFSSCLCRIPNLSTLLWRSSPAFTCLYFVSLSAPFARIDHTFLHNGAAGTVRDIPKMGVLTYFSLFDASLSIHSLCLIRLMVMGNDRVWQEYLSHEIV